MTECSLSELVRPAGRRAGVDIDLPVYSVTKHAGFVPSLEYFSKQVFSRDVRGYKLVEPGDFAYATIHLDEGSIGIAPERALISPMYTVFSIDESRVDASYLIRFLKSPRALAHYPRLGKGAVHRRKAISLSALGSLRVPLPPLDEQRRIASILNQVDSIRTKRAKVLAQIASLSGSIFAEFFAQKAQSMAPLVEIAEKVVVGHVGPTTQYFRAEGVPFLRTGNVGHGEVLRSNLAFVTEEFHSALKKSQLRGGDVLVSRVITDEVRAAILPADLNDSNCANIIVVRPSKVVLADTILGFLTLPTSQRALLGRRVGSAQAVVNTKVLKDLVTPVYPIAMQRDLARRVAAVGRQRDAVKTDLMQVEELQRALHSRAFSGEL